MRFVPGSTVFAVDPPPTTRRDFQAAERQGCAVVATGRGPAYGVDDLPTRLRPGERLHVLRADAATGEVLVRRLDYDHSASYGLLPYADLARITLDGLEVLATTYPG